MVANGWEWIRMVANGREWIRMVANGREWIRMAVNQGGNSYFKHLRFFKSLTDSFGLR